MRIVHLSDIHLSFDNYTEFENYYKDALINDLIGYNESTKIDVIIITGDLVDRGGHSLYNITGYNDQVKYPNPYFIFEEIFINPIINALNFNKNNFLFIPGNHDIDENSILLREEFNLSNELNDENIKKYLDENFIDLKHSKRIQSFKEFEKKFHENNDNYICTNNQSTFFYKKNGQNIGFILVNDSWRCKSMKFEKEKITMFYGIQQIYNGLSNLKEADPIINFILFHHPIDCFQEKNETEGMLKEARHKIDVMLYGHYHSNNSKSFYDSNSGYCHSFRSKASLNKIKEKDIDYIPGYQIFDLDVLSLKIISIEYRMFNVKPGCKEFVYDSTIGNNGVDKNKVNNNNGYSFYREEKTSINYMGLNKKDFKS